MAERTFKVERERTQFLQLIAANPNFFAQSVVFGMSYALNDTTPMSSQPARRS